MIEYRVVHNNVVKYVTPSAEWAQGAWDSLRARDSVVGELRFEIVKDGVVTWQHTINVRQGWRVKGPSGRLEDC